MSSAKNVSRRIFAIIFPYRCFRYAYHVTLLDDHQNKYHEKQQKYKNAYNKLLHASTGASSVGVISGISTIGATFTVVGIPISAPVSVVSTVLTWNSVVNF